MTDQPPVTPEPTPQPAPQPAPQAAPAQDALQFTDNPLQLGHVLYGLYAAGAITGGLTSIAGFILALIVRDKHRTNWLDSHLTWLIRTFIIGFAAGVIAFLLMFVLIGFPLMLAIAVWTIYRIVKGWLAVAEQKPIANPEAWV